MPDKILVRVMTTASGPDFSFQPGHEGLVDAEAAEAMIAGGYAIRLTTTPATAATGEARTIEAEPASEADDWTATATAAETRDEPDPPKETAKATVESATAGPQRDDEEDEQVVAEHDGREAAKAKQPRSSNPHDRRTALGRAWDRGWASVKE